MEHILRCVACGQWTLKALCPGCGSESRTTSPPKYREDDRYGKWRREAKRERLEGEGLL
jgi:H/ACA ribonucleoprotein complex subunit 3